MQIYTQYLLGFDARVSQANPFYRERMPQHKRRFLLSFVPAFFCSVSNELWPSLFEEPQDTEQDKRKIEEAGLVQIPKPEWIGPNSGCWDDLVDMYAHLEQYHDPISYPFEVVALTWVTYRDLCRRHTYGGPYLESTLPSHKYPSWKLLGYDVADGSKWSALTWYHSENELHELRRKFGPRLNKLHLFKKRKDALRYCAFANQEIRHYTHIFQVYGIWRVATIRSYEDLVLQQSMVKN